MSNLHKYIIGLSVFFLFITGSTVAVAQSKLYLTPKTERSDSRNAQSRDNSQPKTLFLRKNGDSASIQRRRAISQNRYRTSDQMRFLRRAQEKIRNTRMTMERLARKHNIDLAMLTFRGPEPENVEQLDKIRIVYNTPKFMAAAENTDRRMEAVMSRTEEFKAASRRIRDLENELDRRRTRSLEDEDTPRPTMPAFAGGVQQPEAAEEQKERPRVVTRSFSNPSYIRDPDAKRRENVTTPGGVYRNIRR